MAAPSSAPDPASKSGSRRRGNDTRAVFLALALLVVIGSALLAFQQRPRPNAWRSPTPFADRDWWLYPAEENAPARLPVVDGTLRAVWCDAAGGRVWAV